jgi:fibronectin type 3 domain-containing protein
VIGETEYRVFNASNSLQIGTSPANTPSYLQTTGLSENSSFSCYVKAFNGVGLGAASSTVTKYTKVHDALVTDFSLMLVSSTQINVHVNNQPPNNGVLQTGHRIEKSTDNVNWGLGRDWSNTTSDFQDQPLTPGQTYYYRILYRNAESIPSAASPSQSRNTSLVPVITTPTKKTRNQNTTIQGVGIIGSVVTVYFNDVAESGTATVNSAGNWSYSVSTKVEGTYTVYARASQGGPQSGNSNTISVTIDTTAPAPPSNVRLACYNNTIDVLWDSSPSSDVAGYQVSRKTGVNGTWGILNTTQLILGNQYRDSTAANGTQYYYRVTAVDNALSD